MNAHTTDFNKLFYQDVREKKRIGSNIHKAKGKRGYVGKLYLTSDLLKGKAKRQYKQNGKVVTWNMYDTIMDYSEFMELEESQQKKTLEEYRKRFTNKEIMEKWQLNNDQYYAKTVKRLGVATQRSNNKVKSVKPVTPVETIKPVSNQIEMDYKASEGVLNDSNSKTSEGMEITLNGIYEASSIQSKLEKLALLIEEDTDYKINITITEKVGD